MMPVVTVSGLTKRFQTKVKQPGLSGSVRSLLRPEYQTIDAVRGISFTVERGEILGFIGPNGAGKSTTIKMLTGILRPTAGQLRVLGLNPGRDRVRLAFHIGSVFGQKSQLWFHLPPADSFQLLAGIYEIPAPDYQKRLDFLVDLFELGELLSIPVRRLSLGQRVRCEIAASLLHQPEIIFLDEPTIGLDVVVKQRIRDLIVKLNREEKTTIFLTSHDVGDIEQLCHRVMIINHGAIVLDEPIQHLKSHYLNKKVISVRYSQTVRIDLPGLVQWKEDGTSEGHGYAARIEVDTLTQNLSQVIAQLLSYGEVADITISDQPLEQIIAAIYTGGPELPPERGRVADA
ncbi:ABC-2 type transport system ATP-binding protein [Hydrogenispora ethanolica]|uniref:ABC-2 type transport system ATP-binding protein n=2 Tax=Hydrogenispora ethanolica TaxID=1082276 RepID=A0A4R1R019_HYDET|nr:ABC-2 type transport system ATP-binding protein [Hydrogenispora ethanolica]